MNDRSKRKVLFLCTGNSARSILAEYLLRSMDRRFETYSAGAEPTGEVHPMAAKVLREVYEIDAADAASKSWQSVSEVDFEIVVTVCDHARDTCPLVPWSRAIQAHWGSEDPVRTNGSDGGHPGGGQTEDVEAVFRRVAEEIRHRLESLCALPWGRLERDELARRIHRIGGGEH